MYLTSPSPELQQKIKRACLVKLAELGCLNVLEIGGLAAASPDVVLERMFEFTGCIRVTLDGGEKLHIYPGNRMMIQ